MRTPAADENGCEMHFASVFFRREDAEAAESRRAVLPGWETPQLQTSATRIHREVHHERRYRPRIDRPRVVDGSSSATFEMSTTKPSRGVEAGSATR